MVGILCEDSYEFVVLLGGSRMFRRRGRIEGSNVNRGMFRNCFRFKSDRVNRL